MVADVLYHRRFFIRHFDNRCFDNRRFVPTPCTVHSTTYCKLYMVYLGVCTSCSILGIFYRSATLYHPQRRAILHLKSQKRKIKVSMCSPPPLHILKFIFIFFLIYFGEYVSYIIIEIVFKLNLKIVFEANFQI